MAGLPIPFSVPHRRSRRFPFDALGAAALAWSGLFLTLAFFLGG
ncbi:MAG TPA: hypothetical protein VHY34_02325 [Caulobacteraceae bacterium]|jgi:hypothetical protein|nr:hypothetical protein [Caulobacteraceae bacterium]